MITENEVVKLKNSGVATNDNGDCVFVTITKNGRMRILKKYGIFNLMDIMNVCRAIKEYYDGECEIEYIEEMLNNKKASFPTIKRRNAQKLKDDMDDLPFSELLE